MARTYKRDSRGRFAGGGGGGSKGGAGKNASKPKASGKSKPTSSKPAPPKQTKEMKAARARAQKAKPANSIKPSPRRFNAEEKALARVMVSSKFRSDVSRAMEMKRLGYDSSPENMHRVYASVRAKVAKPGDRMAGGYQNVSKDAIRKALGITKNARKRKS